MDYHQFLLGYSKGSFLQSCSLDLLNLTLWIKKESWLTPPASFRLGVLPLELNRLLIIVVVLSMALTPLLNEVGRTAAEYIESKSEPKDEDDVSGHSLTAIM